MLHLVLLYCMSCHHQLMPLTDVTPHHVTATLLLETLAMKPRKWCLIRTIADHHWYSAGWPGLAWPNPKPTSGWQPINRVQHNLQRTALVGESGSKNIHLADLEISFEDMACWTICSLSLLAIFVIGGRAFPLPTFPPTEPPPSEGSYDYYAETYLGAYTGPWWVHRRTTFTPNNWGACAHPSLHSLQDGWHTELLRSRASRYWARST